MPFIPSNPHLPPRDQIALREKVYREHRRLLEEQAAECVDMTRYAALLVVASLGMIVVGVLMLMQSGMDSP